MDPYHLAAESSSKALAWLRGEAWPTWLRHGVDWDRGGFHESLDLKTLRSTAPFRRLRVAARQVFVFAEAHAFGTPRAAEAVELGMAFLRERAKQRDGGYARCFGLDGGVTDGSIDLYDHAFVLLALASASRVMPQDPLRQEALDLLRFLDARLAHPLGGYAEGEPPTLPRRQNPHMHLLEACLAAAEAFGEEIFLQRATEMIGLFLSRFRQVGSGTLAEFFDEALLPQRENGRHLVEPGHHCEWVWLLHWYARFSAGRAARAAIQGLLDFVDRHGINPRLGTAYDGVWSDGDLQARGSRLWPQTERLKSETLRPDATAEGIARAHAALRLYLDPAPAGLWHERVDEAGRPSGEPAPASSLYHLTAGILVSHRGLGMRSNPGRDG